MHCVQLARDFIHSTFHQDFLNFILYFSNSYKIYLAVDNGHQAVAINADIHSDSSEPVSTPNPTPTPKPIPTPNSNDYAALSIISRSETGNSHRTTSIFPLKSINDCFPIAI